METEFLKLLAGLASPFAQGLMIAGGMVFAFAGGALVLDWARWRVKGVERAGRIIGVRDTDGIYFPVYEYRTEDGEAYEATGDTGSSSLRGMETGKEEAILVMPGDPWRARKIGSPAAMLFGVACLLPGLALLGMAFTRYPVDGITLVTVLAFAVYFARLYARRMPGGRISPAAIGQMRALRRARTEATPVVRAEDALRDPAARWRASRQEGARMIAGPLFLLAGFCALGWGIYTGSATAGLENNGLRGQGTVAEIAEETSPEGRMLYHPVVRFTAADGKDYAFRDRQGENPAAYGEGDAVTVIYLPDMPEESAAIDSGAEAWILPGFLCLFGLLSLVMGVQLMPRQRDEAV